MRAQIRLTPQWADVEAETLPWAEYQLPIGNTFVPCQTGDEVWVEFPYTDGRNRPDTRRPLITGAAQSAPGGVPNVAPEASGQGAAYEPPAVDGAPARPSLSATADYVSHRNNLLEVRSAGGGFEITNTAKGSRIGMNEAGDMYMLGPGNMVIDLGGDLTIKSGGKIVYQSGGTFSATAPKFEFKQ
ncbi:baseplate protein [Enterobacter sp. BRE11]|nr:baseplate protein [Enterobacter sp. BRE11]